MTTELAKMANVPAIRSMDDLERMASLFAASGFFKDSKEAAQCGVCILAGVEAGFDAFASVTGVHIIQGKPTFSANLMATAVKRSGRYNFRVLEHTDDVCKIAFFERWGSEWQEVGQSSFSLDDAKRANLLSNPTWKNYPRNMLYARAMSNGVRWYAPDALGVNAYTPEELGANVDADGNVLSLPEAPSTPKVPTGPQMVTAAQIKAITEAFSRGQFTDNSEGKGDTKAFVAWVVGLGEPVGIKALTSEQAEHLLRTIGTKASFDATFEAYTNYQAGRAYDAQQEQAAA